MTAVNLRDFINTTDRGIWRYRSSRTTQYQVTLTQTMSLLLHQRVPLKGQNRMESCFSVHTFIHTYPPAASKLTWHHERSSRKQQVHDGDDGDKPNVVGWQCCAPESWAFWASGERRERFVKNGRPRAASMLE